MPRTSPRRHVLDQLLGKWLGAPAPEMLADEFADRLDLDGAPPGHEKAIRSDRKGEDGAFVAKLSV